MVLLEGGLSVTQTIAGSESEGTNRELISLELNQVGSCGVRFWEY